MALGVTAQAATPFCNCTAGHKVVLPEVKVTVPVVAANPLSAVTVAVSVAEVPVTIGLADAASVSPGVGLTAVPLTGIVALAGVALLVTVTSSLKG